MTQPDKVIVRAHIVSTDMPPAHVLHMTGVEPLETAPITTSQEHVLHELGKRVMGGGGLSIDKVLQRKNVHYPYSGVTANVVDLQTKPVDRQQVVLGDHYRWSDQ